MAIPYVTANIASRVNTFTLNTSLFLTVVDKTDQLFNTKTYISMLFLSAVKSRARQQVSRPLPPQGGVPATANATQDLSQVRPPFARSARAQSAGAAAGAPHRRLAGEDTPGLPSLTSIILLAFHDQGLV